MEALLSIFLKQLFGWAFPWTELDARQANSRPRKMQENKKETGICTRQANSRPRKTQKSSNKKKETGIRTGY
jgi:hypothetical protein